MEFAGYATVLLPLIVTPHRSPSVAPMARPTAGPGASRPLDDAAIEELAAEQRRREPEPEPELPDQPGLVTRLELELERQQEHQERRLEQEQCQDQEQTALAADPVPEPAADIRHFSYCYLEKVRYWLITT